MADYVCDKHGLSRSRSCGLIQLPRSTYYHRGEPPDDGPLRVALKEAATERKRWGYRRLLVVLRRQGFRDNHKRIFRVYREENLQVHRRKKRKTSKWRGEPLPAPSRPGERWSMDFVHDSTSGGRRLRMLNIVDDHTRECLAIETDTSIPGARVTRVLDRLMASHGKPLSLLMDNGPEFTGRPLDEWAYHHGVKLQFIEPGKPMQNGYVESFNGKFRDECLNQHWFLDLADARRTVEAWREDYNNVRPHSALGYLTPTAFAAMVKEPQTKRTGEGLAQTAAPLRSEGRKKAERLSQKPVQA